VIIKRIIFIFVAIAVFLVAAFAWNFTAAPWARPSDPILALLEEPTMIEGPYLRFAIWENGRIVHASDLADRTSPPVEGNLTKSDVETLKSELSKTNVTSLRYKSYLVPDAPCHKLYCVVGGRKYMLEWDEYLHPNYGISTQFGPNEKAFVECWSILCELARRRANGRDPSSFRMAETRSWR
jgi:hypothetical protein